MGSKPGEHQDQEKVRLDHNRAQYHFRQCTHRRNSQVTTTRIVLHTNQTVHHPTMVMGSTTSTKMSPITITWISSNIDTISRTITNMGMQAEISLNIRINIPILMGRTTITTMTITIMIMIKTMIIMTSIEPISTGISLTKSSSTTTTTSHTIKE
jgi:hypothetical protein